MASFRFKFKNGEFYELFTLFFDRKDDCYKMLIDKLADFGYSASSKTLVHLEYDGKRHAVRDATSLWNVLEDFRVTNGPNYAFPIEFYELSAVRFRLKDGECCRRFSLKLNREDDAYKVLLNKLNQLGYKSNGRLLLCTENDGSRTVIEDCESLWTLIEINSSGDSHATLQLEYYKPEKTTEQNSTDERILDDDKVCRLEQNVEKLITIIGKLGTKM
uniref:Uncharacterized protein n=1 Tax=Parascaris equorum TaxID=6256 RepID=A0A914RPJ0_PAREQ